MFLKPAIKNIIFDLGGVILNLDVDRTYHQFAQLSGKSMLQLKLEATSLPFFHDYERGIINDGNFRLKLRSFLASQTNDGTIDNAWNAMLLDLPVARLDFLKKLGSQYRIFLLSNTNTIHFHAFTEIFKKLNYAPSLDILFERTYYSHLINMRKPDAEIYNYVLQDNQLKAKETLFLDDNLANLQGATSLGIQTFHVKHPDLIFSLFDEPKP